MSARVLHSARFAFARQEIAAALGRRAGVAFEQVETLDEVLARIDDADMLITTDVPVAEARALVGRLARGPRRLAAVHFNSAGREGFEAAGLGALKGLCVTSGAEVLAPAVAEHALALLLALFRRLPQAMDAQRRRVWDAATLPPRQTLDDATVLVVGMGNIGRAVAERAAAFGSRVLAVTRTPAGRQAACPVAGLDALERLLPEADAVILCIALAPGTRHLIDAAALARMRPEAVLVNVGRGGLVDEGALVRALRSGRLAGAGLDVTEPEPPPGDSALWDAPGLILTSHFAASGGNTPRRLADRAAAVADAVVAADIARPRGTTS